MLTVSQLAKKYRISRTTILYYERAGLLQPKTRSENGYRWYGENELKRLESILAYRSFGLPIADIASLLDREGEDTQEHILLAQFNSLEGEIQKLRLQQKAIVMLLENPALLEQNMVNKERWVEIMRAAGLDDKAMKNWHRQFEIMEPEAHQEFLESLKIPEDEIRTIRQWSKN